MEILIFDELTKYLRENEILDCLRGILTPKGSQTTKVELRKIDWEIYWRQRVVALIIVISYKMNGNNFSKVKLAYFDLGEKKLRHMYTIDKHYAVFEKLPLDLREKI